jgi:hypothetical protein
LKTTSTTISIIIAISISISIAIAIATVNHVETFCNTCKVDRFTRYRFD